MGKNLSISQERMEGSLPETFNKILLGICSKFEKREQKRFGSVGK